jgi:hypothetical protein
MTSLETHNILDTALGLQFNECSIIAADACKYAQEVIQRSSYEIDVILPQEHSDATEASPTKISAVYVGNGMRGDEPIKYYIERSDATSPIRLIGTLSDGITLPLATFQRRIGTACDFVQLGSEIDTDTIVATEEDTPRSAYVGAISMLLQGKASTVHTEVLARLFDEEAKRRNDQMYSLHVASVWKMLVQSSAVFFPEKELGKIRFVPRYTDSSTMTEPTIWQLYDPAGNNTDASSLCLLARSGEEGCYFGVFSREHVVTPLLFLNQKGVYAEDATGNYQALAAERLEEFCSVIRKLHSDAVTHKSHAQLRWDILRDYVGNDRKIFMDKVRFYRRSRMRKDEAGKDVNAYIEHEDVIEEAADRVSLLDKQLRVMFAASQIESDLLGASSEKMLFVAKQLGKILTGSAEVLTGHGVLTDRMIGTTATSADVQLEIVAGPDDTCKVTVRGRPAAFEGVPHETLHQNTVAFYRPMQASEVVTIDVLHDLLQKVPLRSPYDKTESSDEPIPQTPKRRGIFRRR